MEKLYKNTDLLVAAQNRSNNHTAVMNTGVDMEISALFLLLSGITLLAVSGILILYSINDKYSLGSACNLGVIAFALIVTIVADLSFQPRHDTMYYIYEACKVILCGVFVTFYGSITFFKTRPNNQSRSIGHHHGNISTFVCTITIVLLFLEVFLLIGSLECPKGPDYVSACLIVAGMIQKTFQAILYHFYLRYKIPIDGKLVGASWYFKIISLFNFSMWLESIKIADNQGEEFITSILQGGSSLYSYGYAALLIDYRLLCCILFIENSLKIDEMIANGGQLGNQESSSNVLILESEEFAEQFRIDASVMTGLGYLCGLTLLFSQPVMVLIFTHNVRPWANLFSIVSDVVLVIAGCTFLNLIRTLNKEENSNENDDIVEIDEDSINGVDSLMVGMGLIGLTFWFFKCTMVTVWSVRSRAIGDSKNAEYFTWNAAKYGSKILSLIFQIFLFIKADVKASSSQAMRRNKLNHFLAPVIMLTFLSIFLASIISFYNGKIEETASNAKFSVLFEIVYTSGPPIHLGFCLHLFLHFLIINGRLKSNLVGRRRNNSRNTDSRRIHGMHGESTELLIP